MRRFRALGAFALLLSIGTLRADEPAPAADDAPSSPWYEKPFGSPKPKPIEKKAAPVKRPPTREEVAKSLEQEQKIYFERLKFCDKLRAIAQETSDDLLRRKGEKLDNLAFEIYVSKTRDLEKIMKEAKAAEDALEEKRTWGDTLGLPSQSASAAPARAPNGRPIVKSE